MAQEPVTYRIARREDAAVIHGLLVALAAALGTPGAIKATAEAIREHGFGNPPAFEAMLAFAGEQPVGLILYFDEFSTWRGTPGLYVQDLYIAAERRGDGIGRGLIARAGAKARERGATYIRLSADIDNQSAAVFYKSLGFREAHKERIFQLDQIP